MCLCHGVHHKAAAVFPNCVTWTLLYIMVKQQRRVSYNQQELNVLLDYYVFQMPFFITMPLLARITCASAAQGHFTSGYYL